MMDVWERHAERLRRQAQLERINAWIVVHPHKASLLAALAGFTILVLAVLLRAALDALPRLQ